MIQKSDTLLTEIINTPNEKKLYDKMCKKILANKEILAHIMKECVAEYHEISVKDIVERYIEGEPNIGNINIKTNENIIGMATEDLNLLNGKTFYDIRYRALVPSGNHYIELILNIEIQNDYYPGYPLIKRAINYGANMIAGQYGTEFVKSDYSKIKKVYSIWICRDVPRYLQNSINRYQLTEQQLMGNFYEQKSNYDLLTVSNYDLLTVVMIYLGQPVSETKSAVLKLLNTLLAIEVNSANKLEFLENEFGIMRSQKLESEVGLMCNLSIGVERRGIEKGELSKAIEIAKNFLQMKFSVEDVAKGSGLSIDEVKLLQAEIAA